MSMMFPAPKQIVYDQPHAGHGQSKDRISELPDEVLISILSCLSIQEAGRTSILSHRWKNVWKLMIDWTLSLEGILISHQLAIGDRISELPDEVLISILSGLSIREAARTSVLSHRWRNVWKLMMHWSLALQGTGRE